jgi:hypothetical protein
LPDGIYFKLKIPIWVILEGLAIEDVGIIYGHSVKFPNILVHLMAIWYIFPRLVYFNHFGLLHQEKSGNLDVLRDPFKYRYDLDELGIPE